MVKNAPNSQTLRDLDKHRRVVDVDDLRRGRLGEIQCKPEDLDIRLAHVDKAGRDEGIYKSVQLERTDTMRVHLARFIADHNDLQAIPNLEVSNKRNHPVTRLRLRKDEVPELTPC